MVESAPARSDPTRPGSRSAPVSITPGAAVELRRALAGQAGVAVRIWVEPGMHPKALMAIDHVTARDSPVLVDGIPVIVDPPSLRFLEGAQVRFWANRDPPTFEVAGPNLPAVEPPPTTRPDSGTLPGVATAGLTRTEREERIRSSWKKIYDPEIPMNILDLGLIYATRWLSDDEIEVDMTMTSPGCPVAETLVKEVEAAAHAAGGVATVRVSVVWDPPWSPEKMSPLAQRQLGFL